MNTDWNSPQGDFDTAEKQGELLMLLSRQQVTVHTWDDPDFDYMEEQDLALVVQSPSGTVLHCLQFQLQNQRAARIRGKASGKACAVDPKHLAACCQKRQASPLPGRDPRLVHPFAQLLAHAPACRVETVSRLTAAQNKSRIQRSYFSIIRLIF